MLNAHRNHKACKGRGEEGKGVWRCGGGGEGAEREIIHLSLHIAETERNGDELMLNVLRCQLIY